MKGDFSLERTCIDRVWQQLGDDSGGAGRAGECGILSVVASGKEAGIGGGGTKAFLSPWAVSGDSVVHALFLLPIQHVLREKVGEGEGEEVLKTLANWRRAVRVHVSLSWLYSHILEKEHQFQFRPVLENQSFYKLPNCLFFFGANIYPRQLVEKLTTRFPFSDVFWENIQLGLLLSKQKSQRQIWKPIFNR